MSDFPSIQCKWRESRAAEDIFESTHNKNGVQRERASGISD